MKRLSSLALAVAAVVVPSLVITATPAHAYGSGSSLAGANSWIISEGWFAANGAGVISGAVPAASVTGAASTSAALTTTAGVASGSAAAGAGLNVTAAGATSAGLSALLVGGMGAFALDALPGSSPSGLPAPPAGGGPTSINTVTAAPGWAAANWETGTSSSWNNPQWLMLTRPTNPGYIFTRVFQGTSTTPCSTGVGNWSSASGAGTIYFALPSCSPAPIDRLTIEVTSGADPGLKLDIRRPSATSDPATTPRTIEQTVTCKNSAGVTSTISQSTPFTHAGVAGSGLLDVLGLMCPSGSRAVDGKIDIRTPGATPEVVPLTPTLTAPAWVNSIPQECLTAGAAACYLDLTYPAPNATAVPAPRKSCLASPNACVGWWTDPNKEGTYTCRYGAPGVVWVSRALVDCGVYRDFFPEGKPLAPTPDGSGDDAGGSCEFGWGDVLTGAIVYKAVTCALTWAFVPRDGFFETQTEGLKQAYEGTAPAIVGEGVYAWALPFGEFAGDGSPSCLGPSLSITVRGEQFLDDAHPFSTCEGIGPWITSWWLPLCAFLAMIFTIGAGSRIIISSFWTGAVTPETVGGSRQW